MSSIDTRKHKASTFNPRLTGHVSLSARPQASEMIRPSVSRVLISITNETDISTGVPDTQSPYVDDDRFIKAYDKVGSKI